MNVIINFIVGTDDEKETPYKNSSWQSTSKRRWVVIDDLPNTLHEFRTVGKNDIDSSKPSDITEQRPLPGIGMYNFHVWGHQLKMAF